MQAESSFSQIQESLAEFTVNGQDSISPQSKSNHQKLFSSPIHVAQFLDLPKQENSSPDLYIEFTNSFKRILEKDKEQSQENEQVLDIMGHPINQFDTLNQPEEALQITISPIEEDKQNGLPSYLTTPLKIKRNEIRSPLQDITPSMTQKKKKTNSKVSISQKTRLLTPRTMEKSVLASSGLRRIERF